MQQPSAEQMVQQVGYGWEPHGFDNAEIPLYNHKPLMNSDGKQEKEIGEVVAKYRVINPEYLQPHELDHLHRKATQNAWFAWPPGDECLSREFVPMAHDKRGVLVHGEKQMGCGACRANEEVAVVISNVPTEAPLEEGESSPPDADSTSGPPAALMCGECGWVPPLVNKNDKSLSPKQRAYAIGLHVKGKHSGTK